MKTQRVNPRSKEGRKAQLNRQTPAIALKKILVPIDFSGHSKNALLYAVPFAERFHTSLDLLYVVEPTIYPADFSFGQIGFPNIEEELKKRGETELKRLMQNVVHENISARYALRTGKPFYEIVQYAEDEQIDLIIIATHGHSGMEQVLFGSTAEKVVRKAPCPVLVVREGAREFIKKPRERK
jgi:universal stress protein A